MMKQVKAYVKGTTLWYCDSCELKSTKIVGVFNPQRQFDFALSDFAEPVYDTEAGFVVHHAQAYTTQNQLIASMIADS